MKLLGFDITRKAVPTDIRPIEDRGWWNVGRIVREPFAGAWQRNMEESVDSVLTYHAVYACITLIASDISKCNIRLVEQDANGIWKPTTSPAFSPVLRKPNRYQNRIKFYEQWICSKLIQGNTYVLKDRDERRVVRAMYVLDPCKTKPMITSDGGIFYRVKRDNLSGIEEDYIDIPASEIIHDVMVPLYHPLCGVSPLTACGLAASQGLAMQRQSTKFFNNGSRPGGVLTAPALISDVTAERLKKYWEDNFTGDNAGKVAVLGDGLKYEQMSVNAKDAQLIDQLKWSSEVVCSTFHVPAYKVGVGPAPSYNNIEALDQQYYSQCLQKLFECIELCLDEGLGLTEIKDKTYGTEFDLDDLLRMDTATLIEAEANAVGAGIKSPNEARLRLNLGPAEGGDTPYLQQQNYSLAALHKRDSQEDPFKSPTAVAPAADSAAAGDGGTDTEAPIKELGFDKIEGEALGQLSAWQLRAGLASLPKISVQDLS